MLLDDRELHDLACSDFQCFVLVATLTSPLSQHLSHDLSRTCSVRGVAEQTNHRALPIASQGAVAASGCTGSVGVAWEGPGRGARGTKGTSGEGRGIADADSGRGRGWIPMEPVEWHFAESALVGVWAR